MASQGKYRSGSCGLGEIDIIAVNTNTYTVRVRLDVPSIVKGNGSSAVVTLIKVNSSTKYTSNAGDNGLEIQVAASAGDTIKIVTSSANDNDNVINAVRVNWAISEGGSL